ncbi:hypothetical protein [Agromyces aureus]|uniref:Uncharacterized protein n=1 Tax=Agromyces aureus TaxID=453304 RepID=A0A191WK19_9MICO|nr:hypothetical protein [Agromyces aureus]ANJ28508.1 hypothetical protein ATC03_19210 [Agromyces aureus]
MTKPNVRPLALRIAGELRDRSGETPRTYAFAVRDDKQLRVIDQTTAAGVRVLTFEAYRGSVGVYGQYPAVRLDGPADGAWFDERMSARDEGNALTVLENVLVTQLEGGDFARHEAEVEVDVRDTTPAVAPPYAARFGPAEYASVLARGPLLLALTAFAIAWLAFIVGGLLAASVGTWISSVTIVGLVLAQLLAVIAVATAGFAGRSGNGTRTLVLAILAFVWVPLAPAMPVGAFLALVGGALLVAAAASAAAVRVWVPLAGFVVVGLIASIAGAVLWDSAPAAASVVVGLGMIAAAVVSAAMIRRAWAAASARPVLATQG